MGFSNLFGVFKKIICFAVGSEQSLDAGAQGDVVPALTFEKGGALLRLRDFSSGEEERFGA